VLLVIFQHEGAGLLNRISTLIFIQIIFIFSALALIFYYSQGEDSVPRAHVNLGGTLSSSADLIYEWVEDNEDILNPDAKTLAQISGLVANDQHITDVSLIYVDSASGKDGLVNLGVTEHTRLFPSTTPGIYSATLGLLKISGKPYISSITDDGRHFIYIFPPRDKAANYGLVIASPNVVEQMAFTSHSYILLLLFLISALISLLIIHLIFREFKNPINLLLEGIEKTAAGDEFQVKETGDKQIRGLIRSFNEMSSKLSINSKELKRANTELIRTNKSLIESESILTTLVDYSPDAIIVTDLEDQIIIYNQAATRDFGYSGGGITGRKITNLIQLSKKESETGFDSDNQDSQEVICRRKDGTNFPAVVVHTPLGPDNGKPIAMLYFIRSIAESRNYQEMIIKLDRIASRGKMARDIAHEINNYLAILQGNLELIPIILAKNETEKVSQKLTIMRDTVDKISNFTDGLTKFSDEHSGFAKGDLNQLIENLVAFLKPQNKFDDIFITTNLSDELPMVYADDAQLQRLLANLINNAAEAIEESDGDRWIVISTTMDESGENAIIKVADGGPGIDEKHISNMFVKRFSTRRDGTGFGLIACKKIVENHKGEISFHASEDSNAIFEIRIPIGISEEDADEDVTTKTVSAEATAK